MCPACLTTAAVIAAGSVSGAGALSYVAVRYRRLRHLRHRSPVRSERKE